MSNFQTVRKKIVIPIIVTIVICLSENTIAATDLTDFRHPVSHLQGGSLTNTSNYDGWYGCAPTSAGMMMGYYDYLHSRVVGQMLSLTAYISRTNLCGCSKSGEAA